MKEKENAMTKQGLRSASFNVEVLVDDAQKSTFVIRTVQGQPIRVVSSPEEVAEFLTEVINQSQDSNE